MIGKSIPALWTATLALVLSASGAAQGAGGELAPPPGPVRADVFHPDLWKRGGTVRLHLETPLVSLNGLSENSATTWRLLDELHEPLIRRDWETWEHRPVLARSYVVEDAVDLADGRTVFGELQQVGDELRVTRLSGPPRSVGEVRKFPRDEVLAVRPGVVWTLRLRDDVLWHDGHPFDSGDVLFTLALTQNEHFRCPRRFLFEKIERAEALGPHGVRFFFREPYFLAADIFQSLVLLPAHVFEHPDADATPEQRARHVHEHPAGLDWIGLGPYRLVRQGEQVVEAERFDGYFDPAHGGYFDTIRWRVIRSDEAALTALLEGELDFMSRVPSADFFGERTRSPAFTEGFYKGHYYTPRMTYTVWNLKRPPFDDVRVRRALGMCFDWDEFARSYYRGLAHRVTSEIFDGSPSYDRSVEPIPFDLDGARRLLAEAGWYDRDGDGVVDQGGVPFEFELLAPQGRTSEVYGQKLREDLEQVGVRLEIAVRDYGTFAEQVGERDFDAAAWAWFMPIASDPEQIWHSRWIGPHTGNQASFADERADALIDAIQVELDAGRRRALFHQLHALLYESQAYMYGVSVPHKFAASKRIRDLQLFAIEPGYSLRRWYFAE